MNDSMHQTIWTKINDLKNIKLDALSIFVMNI